MYKNDGGDTELTDVKKSRGDKLQATRNVKERRIEKRKHVSDGQARGKLRRSKNATWTKNEIDAILNDSLDGGENEEVVKGKKSPTQATTTTRKVRAPRVNLAPHHRTWMANARRRTTTTTKKARSQ